MRRISTSELQEGMVVASDVRNVDGMLLLPAGCTLGARHLDILQSWGVGEIDIMASEADPEPLDPVASLAPEVREQLIGELKAGFWELDESNPAAMEVFNQVLQRHARRHRSTREARDDAHG